MRKLNYLLSLIAVAAVMISCEQGMTELNPNNDDGDGTVITISASREDVKVDKYGADTKTSIADITFTWVTGDKLGTHVTGGDGTPTEFSLTGGQDSKTGTFSGTIGAVNSNSVYAVYPYNMNGSFITVNNNNVGYRFTLPNPQVQNFSSGTVIEPKSIGDHAYMYGKSANTVGNGDIAISMNHLMSILDFSFTGLPNNKKIHSMTLKAASGMFITYATVNLDTPSVTNELTATGTSIKVNLTSGDTATSGVTTDDGNLTVRVAMLPQTFADQSQWTIELGLSEPAGASATEYYIAPKTLSGEKTSVAGRRDKITMAWSSFAIPTIGLQEETATANCYIVPVGGVDVATNTTTLQFPAVTRVNEFWNGGGGNEYPYGHTNHANSIGADDTWYAEVVWADFDYTDKISFIQNVNAKGVGMITPLKVVITNTPAKGGNVVIGLKKDGSNEYVWSWHIWISDVGRTAIVGNNAFEKTDEVSGNKVVMDRNLGALAAGKPTETSTDTYGFYYQFGRKDPFPTPAVYNKGDESMIYSGNGTVTGGNYGTQGFGNLAADTKGSIVESIKNPMTYYAGGLGEDWMTNAGRLDLWQKLDSYSTNAADYNTKGSKTIFDPCPPGWRLPWGLVWGAFPTGGESFGWITESLVSGRYLTTVQNNNAWFPATGSRLSYSGSSVGVNTEGIYWSGSPSLEFQSAASCLKFNDSTVSYMNQGNTEFRGAGLSVRPVQE